MNGNGAIFMLVFVLFFVGLSGAAAACHFLASGSLKNVRGKGKVITAIILGFVLGLECAVAAIFLGFALPYHDTPKGLIFLLLLVFVPTSLVNFLGAIRGIVVLKNAAVREEFGRPANTRQEPRPVFSKNLVIGLAGGLAGWFFLILVLALATMK
jgi:hypothetical protein